GAGQHDMARFKRVAVLADLVGKPGDTECRVAENARRQSGLLDLGIAVHDAADPAQVDIERPDGATAEGDTGGGAVVGNGIDDHPGVLQPRIDDFDGGNYVFGGAQHFGETYTGAVQPLAHNEGEFDLNARLAVVLMRHLCAVTNHLVVEDVAIVRLVDHGRTLHRLGGQPHLVTDQLAAFLAFALHHVGGDRVRILDGDTRKGLGQ